LSGDVPGEEMRENLLRISQAIAVPPIIGATGRDLQSHGNRFAELPVPLVVGKADPLAAAIYCHTLPWNLPETGSLLLEEDLGGVTRSWEYASAAWRTMVVGRGGESITLEILFVVSGAASVE